MASKTDFQGAGAPWKNTQSCWCPFFEILMILIYFNAIAFTLNALSFPKNLRAIHVGEAS